MKTFTSVNTLISTLILSLSLVACGGGGGDDAPMSPQSIKEMLCGKSDTSFEWKLDGTKPYYHVIVKGIVSGSGKGWQVQEQYGPFDTTVKAAACANALSNDEAYKYKQIMYGQG